MRHNSNRRDLRWLGAALLGAVLLTPAAAFAVDADCDGVDDATDNCPAKFNPTQTDIDGDLAGDRCDSDKDGDLVANDADNCPNDVNEEQVDSDGDGVGDACDECVEDAGAAVVGRQGCSIEQLCPCDGPAEGDAWGNHDQYLRCVKKKARSFRLHGLISSDERRAVVVEAAANSCGAPVPQPGDNDGDGVGDAADNCPSNSNPTQRNTDGDAFGDACDSDKDNDTVLNGDDNCPRVANADGQDEDADADTVGDVCDACSETDSGELVDREGCGIDQLCPCDLDADGRPWASHGKYRRCVYDEVFRFRLLGFLAAEEAQALREQASESTCGEPPPVCQ